MALAATDTALWDLRSRLHGISLARLLGGAAAPRPAYASGGSLSLSTEALVAEALVRREEGYAGFKFRVGSPDPDVDVERTAALRDALGGFPLMADANQGWDRGTARRAAQALAPSASPGWRSRSMLRTSSAWRPCGPMERFRSPPASRCMDPVGSMRCWRRGRSTFCSRT